MKKCTNCSWKGDVEGEFCPVCGDYVEDVVVAESVPTEKGEDIKAGEPAEESVEVAEESVEVEKPQKRRGRKKKS